MKKLGIFSLAVALLSSVLSLNAQIIQCPDPAAAQVADYYLSNPYYFQCTELHDTTWVNPDNGEPENVKYNKVGLIKIGATGLSDFHWYGESACVFDNINISKAGKYILTINTDGRSASDAYYKVNGVKTDFVAAGQTYTATIDLNAGMNEIQVGKGCWFSVYSIELANVPEQKYVVFLDHNDGSSVKDTVKATIDLAMPEITAPEREGYYFVGYFDNAGTEEYDQYQYYAADASGYRNWDKAQDSVTLYAHWTTDDEYLSTRYKARLANWKENKVPSWDNTLIDFNGAGSVYFENIYVSKAGVYTVNVQRNSNNANCVMEVFVNGEQISDMALTDPNQWFSDIEVTLAKGKNTIQFKQKNEWPVLKDIGLTLKSVIYTTLAEAVEGKTIRRAVSDTNYVYVLAIDAEKNPTLVKADFEGNVVTTYKTDFCSKMGTIGEEMVLSDIALTEDGVLVGTNCENNTTASLSPRSLFYQWQNDGTGAVWIDMAKYANTNENPLAGSFGSAITDHMAYYGSLKEGCICVRAYKPATQESRFGLFNIKDSAIVENVDQTSPRGKAGGIAKNADNWTPLTDLYLTKASNKNSFIVCTSNKNTFEFKHDYETTEPAVITPTSTLSADYKGMNGFTVCADGENTMMFIPSAKGVQMLNITDGLDSAFVELEFTAKDSIKADFLYAAIVGTKVLLMRDANLALLEQQPTPEPEEVNTIAHIRDCYEAGTLTDGDSIKVRGYIVSMSQKPNNFAKYGSVCIWLTDTLGGSTKEFELYNCYGMDGDTLAYLGPNFPATGSAWVDVDTIVSRTGWTYVKGDLIEAVGTYKYYSGTHELNTGCYITAGGTEPVTPIDLYVVGTINEWALKDSAYKMTETIIGSEWTYDFGTTELVGQNFKINDGSWSGNYNLGSSEGLTEGTIALVQEGGNIGVDSKYNSATNVFITLSKDADGNFTLTASGTFTEGEKVIPDLYLRGINDNWDATENNKFTRDGENTKWTLTLDVTNTGSFKVADANWGDYNFGGDGSTAVVPGTAYTLVNGSQSNLWLENTPTEGNYTFVVEKEGETWTLTATKATALDQIQVQGQLEKVLINGHLYIIRNDKVYTADGQVVE